MPCANINIQDEDMLFRLAACWDHMPGLYAWKDLDSRYLIMSSSNAKLAGFGLADDCIGQGFRDADMHCPVSELADQLVLEDQQVIATKKSLLKITCLCFKDNAWKLLLVKKHPILDAHGNVQAVAYHAEDITRTQMAVFHFGRISSQLSGQAISRPKQYIDVLNSPPMPRPNALVQRRIIFCLLRGYTNKAIAQAVHLSERAVEGHLKRLGEQFACDSRPKLYAKLMALGHVNLGVSEVVF